jgi:hypothetical protein
MIGAIRNFLAILFILLVWFLPVWAYSWEDDKPPSTRVDNEKIKKKSSSLNGRYRFTGSRRPWYIDRLHLVVPVSWLVGMHVSPRSKCKFAPLSTWDQLPDSAGRVHVATVQKR